MMIDCIIKEASTHAKHFFILITAESMATIPTAKYALAPKWPWLLSELSKAVIIGLDKKKIQCKIVNIFLPIILAYVLSPQKNRLNETVLLSIHNICFG